MLPLPQRRKEIYTQIGLLLYLIHFKYSSSVIYVHVYTVVYTCVFKNSNRYVFLFGFLYVPSFLSAFYLHVNSLVLRSPKEKRESPSSS